MSAAAAAALPFLDADAVARALEYPALIAMLRQRLPEPVTGPVRQRHDLDGESGDCLLTMPAWSGRGRGHGPAATRSADQAALGVKLVTVFPNNGGRGLPAVHAVYVLFDGGDGRPRAVVDGEALTLRRTAAASALAADHLARSDARRLLVVGTGNLAPHMALAHATLRAYHHIAVWGRDGDKAAGVVARLVAAGLPARVATQDLAAAVGDADTITVATTSRTPLIAGAWLRPGQHVDLVGAFRPDMAEVDSDAVARAQVWVDTREGALAEAGELVQARTAGRFADSDVVGTLAELLTGAAPGRGSDRQITLYKSVGFAALDLLSAQMALSTVFSHPTR